MLNCKYCGKECNKYGLKNHERYCLSNPNRKSIKGENNPHYGKKGENQFTKNPGLKWPEDDREKFGNGNRGKKYSNEELEKRSLVMQETVKTYPESYSGANVNGRVKQIKYKGFTLDGGWELLVAKWFDANNIKWKRNIKGFPYVWNGNRTYYPDFFLPVLDLYIEVKGYEREQDKFKWEAVSNLIVLKHKEIKLIKENKYTLVK